MEIEANRPESSGTLTRQQVAEKLGISVAGVRRRERNGTLHPTKDERGVWQFGKDDVEALAQTLPDSSRRKRWKVTEGELAATVFRLFGQGYSLPDVVMELSIPPRKVRD